MLIFSEFCKICQNFAEFFAESCQILIKIFRDFPKMQHFLKISEKCCKIAIDSLVLRDEQILGQESGKRGQNLGQKLGKGRQKFGQHLGHRQFYNKETRFADIMSEMLFKILLSFAQIMSQIMSENLHRFAEIFILRAAAAAANVFRDKIWNKISDNIWDKISDKTSDKMSDKIRDKYSDKIWDKYSDTISNTCRTQFRTQTKL